MERYMDMADKVEKITINGIEIELTRKNIKIFT